MAVPSQPVVTNASRVSLCDRSGEAFRFSKVRQVGRVDAVVGHVHRLWPVANNGPQGIERIRSSILPGRHQGLVPADQVDGSVPDQHPDATRPFFGLKTWPKRPT
jgi:hypothetical protein